MTNFVYRIITKRQTWQAMYMHVILRNMLCLHYFWRVLVLQSFWYVHSLSVDQETRYFFVVVDPESCKEPASSSKKKVWCGSDPHITISIIMFVINFGVVTIMFWKPHIMKLLLVYITYRILNSRKRGSFFEPKHAFSYCIKITQNRTNRLWLIDSVVHKRQIVFNNYIIIVMNE